MENKEDISALNLELLQIDIDKLKNTHLLTRRRYDFIQKKSTVIDEVMVAEDSTIIIE
jgi:uridine kinase